MLVRILGDVDLVTDDRHVALGSRNQRIVLAVLASRRGDTVDATTLIDAIWADDPPTTAVATLRTYVSRLRRHLGDALVIDAAGYRLQVDADEVDAERATALMARIATASPGEALEIVDLVLGLFRGPILGGLGELDALRGTAVRLEGLRRDALETRVRALAGSGRSADAVRAAEELLVDEPLREGVWIALVDALSDDGRTADALRAVQRAIDALADAGLEASPELRAAEQRALRHDQAPAPRDLPLVPDALVGREDTIGAVLAALATHRVVTLVGPGGAGKTRLAVEVARRAAARHRWGARLVGLAGVHDEASVLDAVAGDLGLSRDPGGAEATVANAAALDVLVVLDNCEHVIDAAARVASILTTVGTRARVLATSRSSLDIAGEAITTIDALAPQDAATLFALRARAVRPDLDADDDDVRRVVELVDHLPLAIEMAASQARHLPVAELRRRLEVEFGALRSTRRDASDRHRTLSTVVEWSERLLDEDEHDLFRAMSVFEGPVSPSDVSAVTGRSDPIELLCRLADRSLLVTHTAGRTATFSMLRTIRSRARVRLDERPDESAQLLARHAAWIVGAVADIGERLRIDDEVRAHERILALLDDTRTALAWCRLDDPPAARGICASLYPWAQSRLRDEVLAWAEDLASDSARPLDPERSPDDAMVLCAASFRAATAGDIERAASLAATAARTRDAAAGAYASEVLSDAHLYRGELAAASVAARHGLELAIEARDPHAWAINIAGAALAAAYGGDARGAREIAETPAPLPLQPSAAAWVAYTRGEVVMDDDPESALSHLHAAVQLADSVGNVYVSGVARVSVASLRARTGDVDEATAAFADIIRHWRGRGDHTHQLTTLRNLTTLLVRRGQHERAAVLLGAVADDPSVLSYGVEAERLDAARSATAAALGDERFEELRSSGTTIDLDAAALTALGWLVSRSEGAQNPM